MKAVLAILSSSKNLLLQIELTEEAQLKFEKQRHSIMWTIFDESSSIHSLEFVFDDPDLEIEFKKIVAVKIFEASRREMFADVVAVSFHVIS